MNWDMTQKNSFIFFQTAISILAISNRNSFRVLFDESVFNLKKNVF